MAAYFPLLSQIEGKIINEEGESLPYVNVYVKNSSIGTTSNFDGHYSLKLDEGHYTIVYQYVGYQTQEKLVNLDEDQSTVMNISLSPASYEMPEITISAEAEDPAYAIIRKAQARRKYYKDLHSEFECDGYVRGFNKVYNAPEKIMGMDIGDMDGNLDSTRQGVIYLSESVSKLYVSGSKSKEVMHSSKVSGNDQGYSFNSAQEMSFSFYDNDLELNRRLVSPIASNAMSMYNYTLLGAHYDKNGQLVNKIKVEPKNKFTPCFHGFIYINEDLWNINSLELYTTKEATQIPFIDTLSFKQIYIPLEEDQWMMMSNVIQFRMKAFGFDIGGNFACVYSNYVLGNVDPEVFNREVYVVQSEANEKTEMYWDSIRPIPLTIEEKLDYKKKDSIRIAREQPEYLDSIDSENNKFKPISIFTSYAHQNSRKQRNWSISSPAINLQLNTIQGWNTGVNIEFNKSYNKLKTRRLNVKLRTEFGFSDKQLRPSLELDYLANRLNNLRIEGGFGRNLKQFNGLDPITERFNTILTLFARRNYLKAYDNYFANVGASSDLGAVFRWRISLSYQDRRSQENQYDGSLFYKDSRAFTPNLTLIEDHKALVLRAGLRIKLGEQIVRYPDRIYKTGSDWPTLWINYKRGFSNVLGADSGFELLYASIFKTYNLGNKGEFDLYFNGGKFLDKPEYFVDNMHFLGNQTHVAYINDYKYSFLMMPYYDYSTNDDFLQWHLQHSFDGYLLGKIPLIRRLNWHLTGGYKQLLRKGDDYIEWHVGFDNIGYKLFRLFRVDAVWAKRLLEIDNQTNDDFKFGVVVGLKFKI